MAPTRSASAPLTEPGTSVLPVARVNRIIKADQDIRLCSKEAIFLISKLTELMVEKLADQSHAQARLQKRDRLVKYSDIATAVSSRPAHFFLQEVVPPTLPPSAIAPARAKAKQAADEESAAVLAGTSVGPGAAGLSGPKPKGGRKGRPSAPKVMGRDALAGLSAGGGGGAGSVSGTGTEGGSVAGDGEGEGEGEGEGKAEGEAMEL